MGKYIQKSKITPDISVSPQQSPLLGVRTRSSSSSSKTLAFQCLQNPSNSKSSSSSSFLQLRSRRLEKPPLQKQQQKAHDSNECCKGRLSLDYSKTNSPSKLHSENSVSVEEEEEEAKEKKKDLDVELEIGDVMDVRVSCCQNYMEFGGESRSTAENIPSSLVWESGTIGISDSTSKETSSCTTNSRSEMELCRSIPTSDDIEEFFAHEELWHQRTFIEKYNFDFANEMPLQGRYEWMQMVP